MLITRRFLLLKTKDGQNKLLAINILMTLFTLLLLGIGDFLFIHRKKAFLIFKTNQNQLLSTCVRNFGITFLATGILSLIVLISQNLIGICLILIIGCGAVTAFYLCMGKFMPK